MALSEYDVKGQATVKFNVGSAKISPADEEQLKQLAQTATGLKVNFDRDVNLTLLSFPSFVSPKMNVIPLITSTKIFTGGR